MRIRGYGATDIGRVRTKNEDAYLVDDQAHLYAVADGMGGHQAGEVASRLALEVLAEELARSEADTPETRLRRAIEKANRRVFDEGIARDLARGMGTTLTALWVPQPDDPRAWIGHVGDTRCYLWRGGTLELLTHDHSWVQNQIDLGLLPPEAARDHPMRNVITRSIGFEPELEVDVTPVELQPGDRFLLASDGLTGKLPDARLAELLAQGETRPWPELLAEMLAAANDAGGEDNITAIVVAVDPAT